MSLRTRRLLLLALPVALVLSACADATGPRLQRDGDTDDDDDQQSSAMVWVQPPR